MERARVLLVSMPWEDLEFPSIQLGILLPILQRAGIDAETREIKFDFLEYCISATERQPAGERLGIAEYRTVVELSRHVSMGDWIFSVPPFRDADPTLDDQYLAFLRDFPIADEDIAVAVRFRTLAAAFLAQCAENILESGPAMVGFTSAFDQSVASLALARLLKDRRPDIRIAFGGANCQGPMGEALLRHFPQIDVVVRGEAELVLPELARDLLAGTAIRPQPGFCYRDRDRLVIVPEAEGPTVPMNAVPLPCYDEYFERLEAASFGPELQSSVTLFYEGSRGCWWGEKSHCTFCGISSAAMPFRSKDPDRVFGEILELARRYRRLDFFVVDYIMDLRYLTEVLPRLRDASCDLRLFFEMKANLRRQHVALLRDSGVTSIQSGIESLSTPILRLMKKGVTALQNVRLLKWCAEYGIQIHWNLLYGLPQEPLDEYLRMAGVIRSLTHLEPPNMIRLQLDRFSPYHQRPADFGIEMLGPRRDFRFVYPLNDAALADLVYSFEYRHLDGRDPERYTGEIREAIEAWRKSGREAIGSLSYRRGPDFLLLTDRRPGLPAAEYRFDATEAALYLACEDGASAENAAEAARRSGFDLDADDAGGFLNDLVDARLMFEEGGRYLSLAVPARRSSAAHAGGRETDESALVSRVLVSQTA